MILDILSDELFDLDNFYEVIYLSHFKTKLIRQSKRVAILSCNKNYTSMVILENTKD